MKPTSSYRNWIDLAVDPLLGYRLRSYPFRGTTVIANDPLFGKAPALIFEPKQRPLPTQTRLFQRFLEARTDDELLAFAEQTGALGLCVHGLPTMHPWLHSLAQRGRHRVESGNPDFCSTWNTHAPDGSLVLAESFAAWRAWAESARAICGVAAMLHSRRPPSPDDRDFLLNPSPPFRAVFESEAIDSESILSSGDDWRVVGLWVNAWLALSDVGLRAGLFRDGLRLELRGKASLLGYLATSLASAVMHMPGLGFCSGCGVPFFPKRRQSGRGSYCDTCGMRAIWRNAKRRARGAPKLTPKE